MDDYILNTVDYNYTTLNHEGFGGVCKYIATPKRVGYYGKKFADRESLVRMIDDYIDYYNSKRLQRNLGVLTPMEKHDRFYSAA